MTICQSDDEPEEPEDREEDDTDEEGFDVDTSTLPSDRWPRFNPDLRANPKSMPLVATIRKLVAHLTALETSRGRKRGRTVEEERKFRLAVEALACNLLAMTLTRPDLRMKIVLGNDAMAGGADAPVIYGRHFPKLVHLMAETDVGMIDLQLGHRAARGRNVPSSIRPGLALAHHLPVGSVSFGDFRQEPATDVLCLRERKEKGKAPFLPVPETGRAKTLRNQVLRINKALAGARLDLLDDDGAFPALPFDRTVRRYFNNGSFFEGGRLFGGFWMSMKREDRFRLIRIDGEPIANVDYGQLFPRIAYMRAQEAPPEGDLYAIAGFEAYRDGWKKLMNAALFSLKPLRSWPDETRHLFPEGLKAADAVALLAARHPKIAPSFGTGIGFTCMFAESTMLVYALETLFRRGITALPVHDAVIVARSRAEEAKRVLKETMEEHTSVPDVPVKIEYEAPKPVESHGRV